MRRRAPVDLAGAAIGRMAGSSPDVAVCASIQGSGRRACRYGGPGSHVSLSQSWSALGDLDAMVAGPSRVCATSELPRASIGCADIYCGMLRPLLAIDHLAATDAEEVIE